MKSHEIYRWSFEFFVWNPSWFQLSPQLIHGEVVYFLLSTFFAGSIHPTAGTGWGASQNCRLGCNHEIRKSVGRRHGENKYRFFLILLPQSNIY